MRKRLGGTAVHSRHSRHRPRSVERSGRSRSAAIAALLALVGPFVAAVPVLADPAAPEQVASATTAGAGQAHVCAIVSGAIRCWGANNYGQLGLGHTTAIGDNDFPTTSVNLGGATPLAVDAGGDHTCALMSGGVVRCWGANNYGQLGLANTTTIGDNELPTTNVDLGGAIASAIGVGNNFSCALLDGGRVRCWGGNTWGQLGIGSTTTIGDNESPTMDVDLGGERASAIAIGAFHACALLTGGRVRCWGANWVGALGIGSTTIIGDDEAPRTDVNLGGAAATAIRAGDANTCALLVGGDLRCWGANGYGQAGVLHPSIYVTSLTSAIGDNEDPTENVRLGGAKVLDASIGGSHICAVMAGGGVRCWGYNDSGQLGLGHRNTIGDDEYPTVNVTLPAAVASVAAGANYSCALMTTGRARCWGSDTVGQLGIGSTATIGDDELPTDDVAFDGDVVAPTVTVTAPATGQLLDTAPVRITGSATDNYQVVRVALAIYRSLGGGQYWNGLDWQHDPVLVSAGLTAIGSRSTNWVYTFNAPPGGVYAFAAIALDNTNTTTSTWQWFRIADNVDPLVTLTAPTPGTRAASGPVSVTGQASDASGIAAVQVILYRPVRGGEYWSGSAWQSSYTAVQAALASPGANDTGFTYAFQPPQAGGLFYVAAVAIDASGRYAVAGFNDFRLPDAVNPTGSVTTPVDGATVVGPVVAIAGSAADDVTLAQVQLIVVRGDTSEFFNGTSWGTAFATAPAQLTAATETSSSFTGGFVAPAPGTYFVAALVVDGAYNYTVTPFRRVTVTGAAV